MAWEVTLHQNLYTNQSVEGNNYSDESTGFPAMMRDAVEHVSNIFYANSNTSHSVGTGPKTFTLLDTQRPFSQNMPIIVKSAASPSNLMTGTVTSYNKTTNSITINFAYSSGSGTFTDWIMEIYWIDYTGFTTSFPYKGALASNPVSAAAGDMYFNTGTDRMRVYNGSSWIPIEAPSVASTTVQGIVELATDAETQTGTDTTRVITPSNLSARTATETRTGVAELATTAEVTAGSDDARIVTPLKLAQRISSLNLGTMSTQNSSSVNVTGGTVTGITDLTVADGGTGASNAANARTNLGAAASGAVGSSGITMTSARLLGRTTASTGAIEEITVGNGLTLSGSSIVATSGITLLSAATASNSATIEFTTLDSTYDEYLLQFDGVVPATDSTNINLHLQVSGTWQTSGYATQGFNISSDSSAVSLDTSGSGMNASQIQLFNDLGNASGESGSGELRIFQPSNISNKKHVLFSTNHIRGTNGYGRATWGGAHWNTNNNAVTGLRITAASGNISSGNFRLYGLRKTV